MEMTMDFEEKAVICDLLLCFQKKKNEKKVWVHPLTIERQN
jgi:hypothetical protein